MRLSPLRRSRWSFSAGSIALWVAIALLGIARLAHGGDAQLSWTAPTQRTDGSALTNLASYKIYYGTDAANLANVANVANPGLLAYQIPGLTPATWYFEMTAIDTNGLESARTNPVSKVVAAGLVTIATTVYQVVGTPDRFGFNAVGTVPLGTACDPAETINGRFAVPRAAVQWFGSTKPQIVVTDCQ